MNTNTEALLAAAEHEMQSTIGGVKASCNTCWWSPTEPPMEAHRQHARAILATPSGQRLLAHTERERALLDALIWCSGSPSFQPEGEAREGWVKVCQPLLAAQPDAPEAAS